MSEYTKKDSESKSPSESEQSSEVASDLTKNVNIKHRLWELVTVFTKLGAIAFGGPAAHVAAIDLEVVQRRQWLNREKLLDLLSITNLIPGPNSTELVIHIGLERAGWLGAVVAGVCFILPAMLVVWGLAIAYVEYQTLPTLGWLLYGIKPVIIAIISQALWKLGKAAFKDVVTWIAGILVLSLYFFKVNEILLMLGAGLVISLIRNLKSLLKNLKSPKNFSFFLVPFSFFPPSTLSAIATEPIPKTWIAVFLSFLKIGAVLYGSGYVLLAFVQQEFVERTHWLTSQQLLDAVAIGQFTPGPILTTATFIGYILAGNLGAIAATIGIFLPAFILVLAINPFVKNLRKSSWISGFLDGVNTASISLMAAVTWELGKGTLIDIWTIILAIASLTILLKFPKFNSAWLVIAGAAIGCLVKKFVSIT
ncbi:chromate transporter [Pseudanabaena sp. FACHB-1998]|uniref:chromate transporter n=1 Tax=Pseudanabaena sp. FACHB-1998 TaxID=2692858 RepID=UPI001680C25D|nr:chromate transporter [Pseudanabaena sp. FACHB-1998]MBD2176358.1 chromate transporter [Pseudanabaena sp. FACHB-1998]